MRARIPPSLKAAFLLSLCAPPCWSAGPPLADVHLHYNWDQAEYLEAAEAVRRLRAQGVEFAVVSSKPPGLALELAAAADGWVLPLFMPYLEPERKRDWFYDERVLPAARDALGSGRYRGIGELHLIAGFAPPLRTPHPVIDGLLSLATEFDVPALLHVEAGSYEYFTPLCLRHPNARIVWAHAGGVLPAEQVAALLEACPNVWLDLSARDPMRYGGLHPITGDDGALLPEWRRLVLRYQDRVLVGSDPFFREAQLYWDEPNTGWDHLGTFIDFHRAWLEQLPAAAERKIRLENALRFFRIPTEHAAEPVQ